LKTLSGHDRFALLLFAVFVLVWTALAINPWYRPDWLLENLIVFVAVPVLLQIHRHMPLSKISYSVIFVFLCLHEVGAHYTYAEVPYDRWFESLTGTGLNERLGWDRNHYDRVIHLFYGLLLTYPVREIVLRVSSMKGFWAYLLPLLVVISTSTIFELLEWAAVIVFGGDLGIAYLGTQGDEWDAQKDLLLAGFGALVTTLVVASINYTLDRNFARDWFESLRIKRREPLGEVAIARMLAEKHEAEKNERR
jgi:putative membrane protein